jgi:TIR domain
MTASTTAAPVFISYARADAETFAAALRDALLAAGFPVWWDRAHMESRGLTFLQEIQQAIAGCSRLIVVMSPAALSSDYVRLEWEHALLNGRALTPVLLDGDVAQYAGRVDVGAEHGLAEDLTQLHWVDCRPSRPWPDAVDELRRVLGTPPAALGALHGVPALPPHHLPRPDAMSRLAAALLSDLARPCVITAVEQTAAVQGMGGVGKSVLAAAFARAVPVRRAFPDGIFWLAMPDDDTDDAVLTALRTRWWCRWRRMPTSRPSPACSPTPWRHGAA